MIRKIELRATVRASTQLRTSPAPVCRKTTTSPIRRRYRKAAQTDTRARMPNHIWPRSASDSTYGQCQCVADTAGLAPHAPHAARELVRF